MTRYSLRTAFILLLGVGAVSILPAVQVVHAQAIPAGQTASAACTLGNGGTATFFGASFEQVADRAKFIVEAVVHSYEPRPAPGAPHEGGLILTPARVLKGPETLGQFAVDRFVARNVFEMRPGQHFILFLTESVGAKSPGIPRFDVVPTAMLCIDAGRIRLMPGGGLKPVKFEGVELEKAVADIQAYVGR